jgi:CelD/BcsL family acetyltransferase involved in cellulose biosynthesis
MAIKKKHSVGQVACVSRAAEISNDLQMTCYRSFEQVKPLSAEWDALVRRLDGDIFSSFDWCTTWWKYFGQRRQLEIYVATAGDEMVALLPLFRERIRWGPLSLRVIRIVGCDHLTTTCNITVDPKWLEQVAKTLMLKLDRNGAWDMLHLGELPGYSRHAKVFAEALRCSEYTGRVILGENDYPHMVFDLPQTFDRYLEQLDRKERRNVRRDERQLKQMGPVVYRRPIDKSELAPALSRLIWLHRQYWLQRGRLGHFAEWPKAEQFHRELAELLLDSGRLAFVEVLTNGKLQAAEYAARFGRRLHWITGTRRQEVTSRIGFCALVRSALSSETAQIDALPGYYDYKRRLGAHVLGVNNIYVSSLRMTSRIRTKIFSGATWIIYQTYYRLWFWHVAPYLRRKLPKLRFPGLWAGLWPRFIRARFLVAAKPRYCASLTQPKGLQ